MKIIDVKSNKEINSELNNQNPQLAEKNLIQKTGINRYINLKRFGIGFTVILCVVLITAVVLNFGSLFKYNIKIDGPDKNTKDDDLPVKPTPVPIVYVENPINGLMIKEDEYNLLKNRPILAIMVQNNISSRPEYGLNQADLVYETLAEGGITRFMGIFWSNDVERVQSIRSARKYYVDLLGDYNNPVYMHIGYSDGDQKISAIQAMNKYGIRRISGTAGSFSRDKDCEKVKAVEHCAYTDTERLWKIAEGNKWENDPATFKSWKFTDDDTPRSLSVPLTSFRVDFKQWAANKSDRFYQDYSVIWKYDSVSGKYLRYNHDSTPYLGADGLQIETDTIIYQKIVSYPFGDSKSHQYQEVIGTGTGYIMQNGMVNEVNWAKKDFQTKTVFSSKNGEEFKFKRGKIWVMLVPKYYDYTLLAPTPTPSVVSGTPSKSN